MTENIHANHLINETSPYLRQHAHNPVNWYPWGPAALLRAKSADRPILLSIGYSACHWCHVMERESFEDVSIAQLMNENFVNIKVDREERPDLDQIYQSAAQVLGSQGGWPLTIFLTPDQSPFFGGTYFPPAERPGLPSFSMVLQAVAQAYRLNSGLVRETARQVVKTLEQLSEFKYVEAPLDRTLLDQAERALVQNMDPEHGGFIGPPKFPDAMNLAYLLRRHRAKRGEFTLKMVILALEKMANGGIHDQLGGGFHRYSVDERWLAPHFEKMLYVNALLARLYLEAWQATKLPLFAQVAGKTIGYVLREMRHPAGGFYSSQDADNDGEEGKFFLWTEGEVIKILGEDVGRLFCRAHDVTTQGNFGAGQNILNRAIHAEAVAESFGMNPVDAERILTQARHRLFEVRELRVKPYRDEKILTSWNGLMISACTETFNILGDAAALKAAVESAEFILSRLLRNGHLYRSFKDGQAKLHGYLDDYAFFVAALLDLYQATFKPRYLEQALALHEEMIRQFWDEDQGGFFFTPAGHESLISRPRSIHDHALPSGTSVATHTMLRLHALTGNPQDLLRAERVFRLFLNQLEENPFGFGSLLSALDWYLETPYMVTISENLDPGGAQALIQEVHREFVPNKLILMTGSRVEDHPSPIENLPANPGTTEGMATATLCRQLTCSPLLMDPGTLRALLRGADLCES